MKFIDTHTHISDEAFKGEEGAVVDRALEAGVCKMLMADVDSTEREAMYRCCEAHPGVLYPMLGLYPGSVKEDYRDELDLVEQGMRERRFVAFGEIGLDYHFDTTYKKEQRDAFRTQLEWASKSDMPVNIHLRDATDDFLDILESCKGLALRGNLHAFSGSAQFFRRVRKYGEWSIGLGGVLTFKNAGIAKEVSDIPLECILLETDAPYLAPTPLRGKRNESANIPLIAAKLAELKGISIEEVAEATTKNALKLFPAIQ